ncbi:TonB-dependent receptor plug domain-containing protein, partial [Roseibium sp.]
MHIGIRGYLSGTMVFLATAMPALAQEAKSNTVQLDSITVSGGLIERSQQRTGTSVDVLDAEELEKRPAITNVRDVLENTVNMMVPTGAAKAPTIRGVDGTGPAENANAFFAGSRARLGLRIDGRPASYNEIVFGNSSLWDVEKIEVLRGAQSTLVGRNAIAGNVSITTKDPTFKQSGALQ